MPLLAPCKLSNGLPARHYLALLPPTRCLSYVTLQGEFNALREQLVRQYHDRAALVFT